MVSVPPEILAQVQGSDLFLFLVLVMLFVIGYRILQAVIKVAMVAAMSGVYFVALNFFGFGPAITFDRVILFMILGTGLFIIYSSVATILNITGSIVGFLKKELAIDPSKINLPKPKKPSLPKRKKNKGPSVGDNGSKEKEVILGQLDDED